MIFGNSPFDSLIFKQLEAQERVRDFDHSDSDVTEEEYQLPTQPWRAHREHDQDLFGPKSQEGRTQVSPLFRDDENESKLQRFRDSRVGNGEQWKLFDQEITDTMRQAYAYVEEKKRALVAAANKEKSL